MVIYGKSETLIEIEKHLPPIPLAKSTALSGGGFLPSIKVDIST